MQQAVQKQYFLTCAAIASSASVSSDDIETVCLNLFFWRDISKGLIAITVFNIGSLTNEKS